MSDAARLSFGEEPTEPDLMRGSAAPARAVLGSTWCSSPSPHAPHEGRASTLLFGGDDRSKRRD